ncbi:MAG: hypothetical protein MUC36_04350 [Planctomycetes bacterium]|jgi:hypothetical protein|nr:hypothetical protein [Planctomycetota bacterium]
MDLFPATYRVAIPEIGVETEFIVPATGPVDAPIDCYDMARIKVAVQAGMQPPNLSIEHVFWSYADSQSSGYARISTGSVECHVSVPKKPLKMMVVFSDNSVSGAVHWRPGQDTDLHFSKAEAVRVAVRMMRSGKPAYLDEYWDADIQALDHDGERLGYGVNSSDPSQAVFTVSRPGLQSPWHGCGASRSLAS